MASIISAGTTSSTALNMSGDTSGVLQLASNNGTVGLTMDTSQNVGIGTSSPSSALQISRPQGAVTITSTTTTNSVYLGFNNGGGNSYVGVDTSTGSVFSSGSYGMTLFNAANSATTFFTNATERMRIVSGGGVVVAGTTQIGSARFSTYGGGGSGDDCWSTKPITNITYNPGVFYNNAGSLVGFIQCSGSATTFGTTSDYRLKENIAPMTGALDTVLALKPVTYKWKSTGEGSQGFIAHELQAIVPECVIGEKDAINEDGSIKPQGIDTSFLVATLTAAIQELNKKVTDLEEQVLNLGVK